MTALLIGTEPPAALGYTYVKQPPYDAVVIGSMTLGQLLRFRDERVLEALSQGKPVSLYTPGLPRSDKNRALSGSLSAAQRELKNWGVLFTDGGRKSPDIKGPGRCPRGGGSADAAGKGNFGGYEMKIGNVVGSIWATRKAQCLQGQTFLVVCSGAEELVAADQVGAGPGDRVLLATGTVASRYCMDAPVDAAVVAILDSKKE